MNEPNNTPQEPVHKFWFADEKSTHEFHHIRWSDNLDQLATALAKAQGKISGAKKDSTNPFFKSQYADLASVLEAIREPFAENGLSLSQHPGPLVDGKMGIVTVLMHASGQYMMSLSTGPIEAKLTLQELGKSVTYLRRYAASAVAGVAQVDDDGNEGSGVTPKQAPVGPAPKGYGVPRG